MSQSRKVVLSALFIGLSSGAIAADGCASRLNMEDGSIVASLISCLQEIEGQRENLSSENTLLQARVKVLEEDAQETTTGNANLKDAVVAFDLTDSQQCPSGWHPFRSASARVIIGAGDPADAPGKLGFDQNAAPLTYYVRGQHGGEEKHLLSLTEMPSHDHGGIWGGAESTAQMQNGLFEYHTAGHVKIKEQGGGKAHNNMQPYIALYYCKKD